MKLKGTQIDTSISPPRARLRRVKWRRYWRIGLGNLARLQFVSGFEMAAAVDMTIVDQS